MTTRLSHGFTPTDTCPTEDSNNICFGYVVFDSEINRESFAHRDQQPKKKHTHTCVGYIAPKSQR